MKSLRVRVIVASVLWTGGLLALMHLLSLWIMHALPGDGGDDVAIAGTTIGTLLMAGGGVLAWRSLAPLRGLEKEVVAVTRGDASRVAGRYPAEVQPVIDRLNVMLEDRERAVARAHAAAGDLAHALKTPLALLLREAETARASGQAELADAITGQVRRMTAHVDRQLARARLAAAGPGGSDRTPVEAHVEGLIRTMRRLHAERRLDIAIDVPAGIDVRLRPEDFDEMLGNLLDNACKWARSRVRLAASVSGSTLRLLVDDDGEGLPEAARTAALKRGVRLDEAAPGSGLGLAIVRDLLEHYQGAIALDSSPLGGLRVTVDLPLSPPRTSSGRPSGQQPRN